MSYHDRIYLVPRDEYDPWDHISEDDVEGTIIQRFSDILGEFFYKDKDNKFCTEEFNNLFSAKMETVEGKELLPLYREIEDYLYKNNREGYTRLESISNEYIEKDFLDRQPTPEDYI